MKLSAVLVGLSLLALPLMASAPSENRSQEQLTSHQMTLEDRVTVLERDTNNHETSDIVKQEDTRKNVHDLSLGQGKQDERIVTLESRTQAVYQAGTILGWVLGILITVATTLFTVFYQDYRKEAVKHHDALQVTLNGFTADIRKLEKHFNIAGRF